MQLLSFGGEGRSESVSSPYQKKDLVDEGEMNEEATSSIAVDDEEVYGDGVPVGVLTMVIVRSR